MLDTLGLIFENASDSWERLFIRGKAVIGSGHYWARSSALLISASPAKIPSNNALKRDRATDAVRNSSSVLTPYARSTAQAKA